ncbi:MAG TPA: hypothetical protein VEK76_06835 [Candidatus Binatia bacterium]|nr:hypothetical protein [Candidatus Binatia bacterium]
MLDRLRWFKRLVLDLPRQLRLAYCLFRDPRVPLAPKAGLAAALGLIITPVIDLPEAVPIIGEIDAVALTLLALRAFTALCPAEVVTEQERLIAEGRSRFDQDVAAGERLALALTRRLRRGPAMIAESPGPAGGGQTTPGSHGEAVA